MKQRVEIKTLAQATEELQKIPALYAQLRLAATKADTVDEVLDAFDHVRVFLDKQRPRNWDAETDLKAAYVGGQEILKHAFDDYIRSLQPVS